MTTSTGRGRLEEPCFCTAKETAWYLRLCEKQVRRLIARGELPAYRFGTAVRIKRQDIEAYVEARRSHAGLNNKSWKRSQ